MAETAIAPSERIKNLIETEGIKKRFVDVLGNRAPAFLSSIVSAYASNKNLSDCDPMSVISSAMVAATLDLPINANLGMAYIVPYSGVGTFQMGWKGFVQLALRSGQYKTINATPIYEGQLKNENPFTGEMEFVKERASDKVSGYLLYFKLLNGFEKYVYWTREKCERHGKQYSASYKKGYGKWMDQFDDMALKSVVKNGLSKYGPLSVSMQTAIEKDESFQDAYPDSISTDTVPLEPAQPNRLKSMIGAPTETTAAPEIEFPDPKDVPL